MPRHLRIHWKTGILLLLSFAFCGCGGEKPENEAAIPAPPVAVDRTAPIDSSPVTEEAEKLTTAEPESGPPGDNTPPVMASVKLAPTLVFPGTRIKAQVEVSDPDGDLVMLDYKWTRNGAVLDGEVSDGLDTDAFQKGDLITLTITPSDEKAQGKSKESRSIVILNRPPEIISSPSGKLSEGKYIYEVKAQDPDDDRLAYSLEDGPPGMKIDAAIGRLEWEVPAEPGGSVQVRIAVSDGDARAFQGFSIQLKKE